MTTYTLSGYKTTYVGNTITSTTGAQMTLVVRDTTDDFKYSVTTSSAGGSFPEISFAVIGDPNWTGDALYTTLFDGVSQDIVFPDSTGMTSYFGYLDWGAGNTSYTMAFNDNVGVEYMFQIGGDLIPDISTLAASEAFTASVTGGGEVLSGTYAPDTAISMAGIPDIFRTERDVIRTSDVATEIHAGIGRDRIVGGAGNDTLYGDQGRDAVLGGGGNDKMYGGNGSDRLLGGDGRDVIWGGNGNDRLDGGAQKDRLFGGKGDDQLTGGGGRDVFAFTNAANQGNDVILDFQDGKDQIKIGGSVIFTDLSITTNGTDTTVSWLNTQVTLLNTDIAAIDQNDFIF